MQTQVPLFYTFAPDPPEADACLDRVYAAFADIEASFGWCRHCFPADQERGIRSLRDPRAAQLRNFSAIYYEHPDCSGGETTFLHWLPRGLELGFFDPNIEPGLIEQALRLDLWRWPDEQQAALHDLFRRVAVNWFRHGHAAPLQIADRANGILYGHTFVSRRIVKALLYLRTRPTDLFAWLTRLDRLDAWTCLLDLLRREAVLDGSIYYVASNEREEAMKACHEALERIARQALHEELLTDDRLLRSWLAAEDKDPELAAVIAETEWLVGTRLFRLTPAERAGDEARIRASLAPSTSSGRG